MSESETYKELGALTRCKERWERWGWHIHEEPLLRERAVNALGRIGRGCFKSIQAYWLDLQQPFQEAEVR